MAWRKRWPWWEARNGWRTGGSGFSPGQARGQDREPGDGGARRDARCSRGGDGSRPRQPVGGGIANRAGPVPPWWRSPFSRYRNGSERSARPSARTVPLLAPGTGPKGRLSMSAPASSSLKLPPVTAQPTADPAHSPLAPRVTAVIVNFNGGMLLADSVKSVLASTEPVKVVVSDNGSTDGSIEHLRRTLGRRPQLVIMENDENLGFAKGNNVALPMTEGEHILFLNPDCIIEPDTIAKMMRPHGADSARPGWPDVSSETWMEANRRDAEGPCQRRTAHQCGHWASTSCFRGIRDSRASFSRTRPFPTDRST